MSSRPFQPSNDPSMNPYSLSGHSQEYKASYDDLIDNYAAPYGTNSQHQTYHVGKPPNSPPDHRRGPSYPPLPSKQSVEGTDSTHVLYPPHLIEGKEKRFVAQGFWRRLVPESLACRLYVLTVLVETTINLAIEGELLIRFNDETEDSRTTNRMPVYLSVFALAHVFQFAMAIDAVHARNTLQFISLAIFNWVLFGYSIIQIFEVRETLSDTRSEGVSRLPVHILTAIIPAVTGVAALIYGGLAYKIYHEFGWKVYKFLGADRRIKKMYANYQIYECLVKFDVFFWAGFSIQFIWLVLQVTDWEYYVTCAALPLSLVLLVEGHLAARHENRWMMYTFMSGCVGAMIYFVYKLVKVLMYKDTDFRSIWKTLLAFSVIAIALLLLTFIYSTLVLQSFGRGLKESLTRKDVEHKRQQSRHLHGRAASTNLNRMSIE